MKITPARRRMAPIGPKAMLIPPNTCAGGSPFSCMAALSTRLSRFDRCDHRKMHGWRCIAARSRAIWPSS